MAGSDLNEMKELEPVFFAGNYFVTISTNLCRYCFIVIIF